MKKRLVYLLLLAFIISDGATAIGKPQHDKLKKKMKEMHISQQTGKKLRIDSALRKEMHDFVREYKAVELKDFHKLKLLNDVSEIALEDYYERYQTKNFDDIKAKIKDKKEKELLQTFVNSGHRYLTRDEIMCGGSETGFNDFEIELIKLEGKAFSYDRYSDEAIKMHEKVLMKCKYKLDTIWRLLSVYSYLEKRDKYNKLMLRILKEDLVEFDYGGTGIDDYSSSFRNEFLRFLMNNSLAHKEILLKKNDVKMVAEAAINKYQLAFSLEKIHEAAAAEQTGEEAYDPVESAFREVMISMTVIPSLLKHYKLDELRKKYVETIFLDRNERDYRLIVQTLKTYSDFAGFQENLDYLKKLKDARGKSGSGAN